MLENSEQFIEENSVRESNLAHGHRSAIEVQNSSLTDDTQKLSMKDLHTMMDTALPTRDITLRPPTPVTKQVTPGKVTKQVTPGKRKIKKQEDVKMRVLQEHCRQLCLSLFFNDREPIRSLGFTSVVEGEGKSFLSIVTARMLAHDSNDPVTLLDCNWEHPSLHEYFGIPATPGLAEWLQGYCEEDTIRYQVDDNLTVIPAGNGLQDAAKLLKQIHQVGLLKIFASRNELFIVDLPPILTTGYGVLAANLLDSIEIVVRAQAITESMLAETCMQLRNLPVHGIILNQEESRIPRWIQKLL